MYVCTMCVLVLWRPEGSEPLNLKVTLHLRTYLWFLKTKPGVTAGPPSAPNRWAFSLQPVFMYFLWCGFLYACHCTCGEVRGQYARTEEGFFLSFHLLSSRLSPGCNKCLYPLRYLTFCYVKCSHIIHAALNAKTLVFTSHVLGWHLITQLWVSYSHLGNHIVGAGKSSVSQIPITKIWGPSIWSYVKTKQNNNKKTVCVWLAYGEHL